MARATCGCDDAVRAGEAVATGDMVIVQQRESMAADGELRRLWNASRRGVRSDAAHAGPRARFRLIRQGRPAESQVRDSTLRESPVSESPVSESKARPGKAAQRPSRSPRRPFAPPLATESSPLIDQSIRSLYS